MTITRTRLPVFHTVSGMDAMPLSSPPPGPAPLVEALERQYEELQRYAARKYAGAAGDLVHDAWIRLATRGAGTGSAEAVRDPGRYLRTVIDNVANDQGRVTASRSRFLAANDTSHEVPSPAPSPYQSALSRQEYAVLLQAIRDLPPQARRVFVLFRGRNMSTAQIAAHLDISPRTVEKHIAVAVTHCRRRLREAGREI
ncbi:RNA polymerase sigma factor [Xanthomonas sacchari]